MASELRAVLVLALDRVGPLLERVGSEPASGPSSCASCPVCAVLAALRGERPELAVRLSEHATGLVAALRAALEADVTPTAPEASPARPVQRIHVERAGRHGRTTNPTRTHAEPDSRGWGGC
jgi:hypothetical protein